MKIQDVHCSFKEFRRLSQVSGLNLLTTWQIQLHLGNFLRLWYLQVARCFAFSTGPPVEQHNILATQALERKQQQIRAQARCWRSELGSAIGGCAKGSWSLSHCNLLQAAVAAQRQSTQTAQRNVE